MGPTKRASRISAQLKGSCNKSEKWEPQLNFGGGCWEWKSFFVLLLLLLFFNGLWLESLHSEMT